MKITNFSFLTSSFPDLAECGSKAEEYVWTDPTASLIRSRMFIEITLRVISEREGGNDNPSLNLSQRLGNLKTRFPAPIRDSVNRVRLEGNKAAHCQPQHPRVAMEVLKDVFEIGKWIHSKYITPISRQFFEPADPRKQQESIDQEVKERDSLIKSLSEKLLQKEKELRQSSRTPSQPQTGPIPFTVLFEKDGFEFGKNMVKDTRTGLFWARNGNIPDFPPRGWLGDWGTKKQDGFGWLEAQKWAAELTLDGYCDWRLPTKAEFFQLFGYAREHYFGTFPRIIDSGAHNKCSLASYFCSIGFTNIISNVYRGTYWTSDIDASGVIWEAKLSQGKFDNFTNAGNWCLVWPVRDGGLTIREEFKQHWHIVEEILERFRG